MIMAVKKVLVFCAVVGAILIGLLLLGLMEPARPPKMKDEW